MDDVCQWKEDEDSWERYRKQVPKKNNQDFIKTSENYDTAVRGLVEALKKTIPCYPPRATDVQDGQLRATLAPTQLVNPSRLVLCTRELGYMKNWRLLQIGKVHENLQEELDKKYPDKYMTKGNFKDTTGKSHVFKYAIKLFGLKTHTKDVKAYFKDHIKHRYSFWVHDTTKKSNGTYRRYQPQVVTNLINQRKNGGAAILNKNQAKECVKEYLKDYNAPFSRGNSELFVTLEVLNDKTNMCAYKKFEDSNGACRLPYQFFGRTVHDHGNLHIKDSDGNFTHPFLCELKALVKERKGIVPFIADFFENCGNADGILWHLQNQGWNSETRAFAADVCRDFGKGITSHSELSHFIKVSSVQETVDTVIDLIWPPFPKTGLVMRGGGGKSPRLSPSRKKTKTY